ncbi:MAG TPA: hypothetical protein VL172_18635, partial [Kofleriaceae bacterium]|nr:hypothetical protein [Kofleriaceae bacterium]
MSHEDRCIRPLRFPRTIDNRPGLSRLAYRVGNYADIREALLRWRDQTPELAGWTHRGADDPGVALLEGTAILGDILAFYQELYANECYLRTASWRDSITELVRLTGYRLAPAIGGRGRFAATLVGDDPVVIPAGFPLTAQLVDIDGSVTFETAAELTAYPWLAELALYAPVTSPSIDDETSRLVVDGELELRRGDRIYVGIDMGGAFQSFGTVAVVARSESALGRTTIELRAPLHLGTPTYQVTIHRIGRSFRHFGHNAPPSWAGQRPAAIDVDIGLPDLAAEGLGLLAPLESQIEALMEHWFAAHVGAGGAAPGPVQNFLGATRFLRDGDAAQTSTTDSLEDLADHPLQPTEIPLDARVPDLTRGARVLCVVRIELASFTYGRTVVDRIDRSMSWGPMTAGVTLITVDAPFVVPSFAFGGGGGGPVPLDEYDIRTFDVHEVTGGPWTAQAAPPAPGGRGRSLLFYGSGDQAALLQGRSLLLVDGDAEPMEVTVTPTDVDEAAAVRMRAVAISEEVDLAGFDREQPRARLLGNLVEATEGATQAEVKLGNGDARALWQTFRLPKAPLTYLRSAGAAAGRAPELTV